MIEDLWILRSVTRLQTCGLTITVVISMPIHPDLTIASLVLDLSPGSQTRNLIRSRSLSLSSEAGVSRPRPPHSATTAHITIKSATSRDSRKALYNRHITTVESSPFTYELGRRSGRDTSTYPVDL
jgi:hypothetical protein